MIRKVKGGYQIFHCRSGKSGPIDATKKPVSKKKALSILQAITTRRGGRGKTIISARKSK